MEFSKINPVALGVSVGVLSAVATFFMGLAAFIFYAGKPLVGMMGTMYISYNPSLANAGLGAAIVFINSFIGCYIAAWVYNFLLDYI